MTPAPDVDVLTALLRRHVDDRARCAGIQRTSVGNSQETWIVEVAGVDAPRQLVLRRSASGGTIEWTDRATEVVALEAARAAALPVPRVWWWEPDGGTLERAYLVMDRAPGGPPDLGDAAVRHRLTEDLARQLARLHLSSRIPELLRADGDDGSSAAIELERWTTRATASGLQPELLMALCGWLRRTAPVDDGPGVLLWGDPGPHNVLCDGSGQVVAMLDWELAAVGDRAADLGAARWACLGHLDRDLLTAAYEREYGDAVDGDRLKWHEVMACVSRSVMLLDGVRATIDGRANDPNVLALGTALLSANLVRGAAIAWGDGVLASDVAGAGPAGLRPTDDERDRAVARFLTTDVLPAIDDRRLRRGVKIAAAMLQSSAPSTVPDGGSESVDHSALELAGAATDADRRRLVAAMLAARRAQQPLLDLYGQTTAIPPHPDW